MAWLTLQGWATMAGALTAMAALGGSVSLEGDLARLLFLALLSLFGVGFCWALLLALARWAMARMRARDALGDSVPTGTGGARRHRLAPAREARKEPAFDDGLRRPEHPAAPDAALPEFPDAPREHTPARALPMRKVRLSRLPHLEPLGALESARPEWTGAVAPSSLEAAGAVDVARIALNRELAGKRSDSVHAVDYRILSLPRADQTGQRLPNMLVYTAHDRGIVPKRKLKPLRRKA